MPGRKKSATPAASPPPVPTEHIYIASEDVTASPALAARTLRETVLLRNPVRRTGAQLGVYD